MVPGKITYPAGNNYEKTHWCTYNFRESDGIVGTSISPSDQCTSVHGIFLSEIKETIRYGTERGSKPMKYTVPRGCRRPACVLSHSRRTQSEARHRPCSQQTPSEKASRGPRTQQHVSKQDEMPSSACAQGS